MTLVYLRTKLVKELCWSGICAGLGNVNSEYAGVAEDSELIVIKLGKIEGFYNSAMLFAASQYAYNKAFELGRPLVINVSLGTSSLAGLTNRVNSEKAFLLEVYV